MCCPNVFFRYLIAASLSALVGISGVGSPNSLGGEPLTAVAKKDGVLVREGTKNVLFYQREEKSQEGKWPRANYIHPLYNATGDQVITEDFPSDHGHHRGVFWAWHQVRINGSNLGDSWACKDFIWDVQSVEFSSPGSPLQLKTRTHWKSPGWVDDEDEPIPFVEESVAITIHPSEDARRKIDFEISLRALVPGVEIGGSDDKKGYGGFSPRLKLSSEQTFHAAGGIVEPQTTSVDAGTWVRLQGDLYSIKIIADPKNPPPVGAASPTHWILRRQRSMQNPVYPGRDCVPLSAETPTVLKYHLMIE